MTVRMREVAERAGVSEATVSLALSGSARISEATRSRVVETAKRLGYRPHAGARSLRTASTNSLGLVVTDVANPFFAELAGEIQRIAADSGYSIVLCNSDEDPERQDAYLSVLLAGSRVDGVILVPTAAVTSGIRAAAARGSNLVLLDRLISIPSSDPAGAYVAGCPAVRSSAGDALDEAAEMLTGFGHRRVGIIAPPLQSQIGRERRDLFRDALVARGLSRREVLVVEGDFRQASGHQAARALMSRRRPPTAIFAAGGLMAMGAMKGLRESGVRIPDDVSLLAFDDPPWFDLLDPPLTAIAQPVARLADQAVRAMLALLGGERAADASPDCLLVRRGSCGPVSGLVSDLAIPPKTPPSHRLAAGT